MELISRLSNAGSARIRKDVAFKQLGMRIDQICGNQKISKDLFRRLIVSRNSYFSDRLFQLFDSEGHGFLVKERVTGFIKEIIERPRIEKLKFFFQINDIDGDGLISFYELRHLLESCMTENGLVFSKDEIHNLTRVLFEHADTDHTGTICFEEFQALLAHHEGLIENICISMDRWLLPSPPEAPPPPQGYLVRKLNYTYIRNNLTSVTFFIGYCIVNLVLFAWRVTEYAEAGEPNAFVWIARGAGICLNFNGAFIILLILRRTLTYLRTLGLTDYFPIDQHIYYHKICGYVIALFSAIHTIAHIFNFAQLAAARNISWYTYLFQLNPTFKWFYGAASLTGWACLLSLTIIVFSSLPCVRKSGHFEIFYYFHLFYFVFWVALVLHGPVFWIWSGVPLIMFFVERIILIKRVFGSAGHTYIEKGVILPSRVVHLVIKRPPNFDFRPGDWLYLQIPSIAKWEWHPFTISSAPEMEDVLWLHIRGVGEWTKRVRQIIEQQERLGIPLNSVRSNPVFVIDEIESLATPVQSNSIALNPMGSGLSRSQSYYDSSHTRTSSPSEQSYIRLTDSTTFTMPLIGSQASIDNWSSVKPSLHADTKYFAMGPYPRVSPINAHESHPLDPNNNPSTFVGNNPNSEMTPDALGENNASFHTIDLSRSRCPSFTKAEPPKVCKRIGSRKALEARLSGSYPGRRGSKLLKFPRPEGKRWSEPLDLSKVIESFSYNDVTTAGIDSAGSGPKRSTRIEGNRLTLYNDLSDIRSDSTLRDRPYPDEICSVGPVENMVKATIPLPVRLDGPYGSPSSHIFNTQHAVLISTGIGVTPFASILQSIMFRYLEGRQTCPQCCYSWSEAIPPSVMKLKKVDFVWINREQRSFEWFVHLLSQLEITQAELMEANRFLDMHIYITSALDGADIRAIGLQLALDLMHEKKERDLISGLRTRTKPGRPVWSEIFEDLRRKKKGKVSLFYCGAPTLGKELHSLCNEYGFNFHKEIF